MRRAFHTVDTGNLEGNLDRLVHLALELRSTIRDHALDGFGIVALSVGMKVTVSRGNLQAAGSNTMAPSAPLFSNLTSKSAAIESAGAKAKERLPWLHYAVSFSSPRREHLVPMEKR